jgi:zinc transport system permease protein
LGKNWILPIIPIYAKVSINKKSSQGFTGAVQIVGVLLITSLLIIPPAVARVFAGSPVQMVFLSIVVSIIAVVVGLNSSIYYDVATGPAIVIALGVLFGLSQLFTSKTLA